MAEIQNWQKQNMSKNGGSSASAPCDMSSKLMPKITTSGLHSKIAKPTFNMGGMVSSNAARKVVPRFADGTPGGVQFDQGEFAGVDKAVADNTSGAASLAGENYGDGTTREQRMEMATGSKAATDDQVRAAADEGSAMPKTFKEAFAENRKAGNKEFEWNGGKFSTKYDGEGKTSESRKQVAAAVRTAMTKPAASTSTDSDADPAPASSKSIMFKDSPAKAKSSTFDPNSTNNFGPRPEPVKERTFRQTRGGRIYDDELPTKEAAKPRVHPRTGRPI